LQSAFVMREAEVYRTAFEKEKELTDRALRLTEVGKPKSNWELQGILGLAVFFLRIPDMEIMMAPYAQTYTGGIASRLWPLLEFLSEAVSTPKMQV